MKKHLYLFLAACSLGSLVSGLFGKVPLFFCVMSTTMPIIAVLGLATEDAKKQKSKGVRIAETTVAVVIGVCSILLTAYGFAGLF